jgi:HSP20 family protein
MALATRQNLWDPFREMEQLNQRVSRLFGLAAPTIEEGEYLAPTSWMPSCDISESDKAYFIRAELPDVKKDDVHVNLENGVLTIQGERKELKEEKDVRYHRRELTYGSFIRRFTLPEDINPDKVDANFKDGMLTVTVQRDKARHAKAKQIDIH